MRKWIFNGERNVSDEQNRKIRLEYYLEEDVRDIRREACLYGIRVVMYRETDGCEAVEIGSAPAISYSGEFVKCLLNKLQRMAVTPTSLLEIVDDETGIVSVS